MKLISVILSKKQLAKLRKLPFGKRHELIQSKLTERMLMARKLKS